MKKSLLFLFLSIALGCTLPAAAQDLILKRDSSRLEARVTEISPTEVRYKRYSNPDGPTYVVPVGDILSIRYANGEEELFAAPEAAAPIPASASVDGRPEEGRSRPVPAASADDGYYRRYAVGDYYDRDGVRGIVCYVDASGRHGLILSLDEASLAWSAFRKPDLRAAGTDHPSDGQRNMENLARYIEANGLSWNDFPAFGWCREQGEGWYLPSIDEMLAIGHGYHGGSRTHNDRKARNRFNDALRTHGGKRMDRMMYYFSSTEKDGKEAFASHMEIEPPYLVEIPKHNKFLVRAVHKF
ncbi:MAG: hypothetical protein NC209_01375 [Alistipes sp.]|nr:hypothetical protein [Alistipes senegalensis]MCM1249785.1 hypothetical protein [Alistipes sp.]